MTNPFGKKEDIYGFETLFREIGYYISRLEQYERSLHFFDEAIKKTPNDKRALIGRSRARAKAIQYEGALEDIIKALNLDPDDLLVLADKALNTYLCCEFEAGLVQNARLLPKRQKPENFFLGVMHCSDAIENCVGERTGRPLRDHFKIIRKIAWKKNYAAQKPFEPKPRGLTKKKIKKLRYDKEHSQEPVQPKLKKLMMSSRKDITTEDIASIKDSLHSHKTEEDPIPPFKKPFPFKPLQDFTTNIDNYMAEKYLNCMYLDKIFLRKLRTEPGAICPNKKGSKEIKQVAKNAFRTVAHKQELLRTRRPFYFIKYQEAKVSGALKQRQEEELGQQQETIKKEADVLLAKLIECCEKKNLRVLLDIAEKLKQYCDSKPKRLFPDKENYVQEIYEKICKGFYDVYRINNNQYPWDQEKRIQLLFGIPLSREPSSDSVIAQFKNVFVDYKKQIRLFEKRLKNASRSEEMCWYYHELSRYHIELKKYELARVYAKKCIQEGKIIGDLRWVLNGTMLMTSCNVQQHNKNDAKNDLLEALHVAKELNDENLEIYLDKCQTVLDKIEFDDIFGPKVLEKREKKIISMMADAKMKDEVAHLFRQMSAMPASRRMVVIPGIRLPPTKEKSPYARKMSIMPGKKDSELEERELQHTIQKSKTKIRGGKEQKTDSGGNEFMELIQFHV